MKRHFMVKHRRLRVAWLFALVTLVAIIVLHLRTGHRHDDLYVEEDPGEFISQGLDFD